MQNNKEKKVLHSELQRLKIFNSIESNFETIKKEIVNNINNQLFFKPNNNEYYFPNEIFKANLKTIDFSISTLKNKKYNNKIFSFYDLYIFEESRSVKFNFSLKIIL